MESVSHRSHLNWYTTDCRQTTGGFLSWIWSCSPIFVLVNTVCITLPILLLSCLSCFRTKSADLWSLKGSMTRTMFPSDMALFFWTWSFSTKTEFRNEVTEASTSLRTIGSMSHTNWISASLIWLNYCQWQQKVSCFSLMDGPWSRTSTNESAK